MLPFSPLDQNKLKLMMLRKSLEKRPTALQLERLPGAVISMIPKMDQK